MKKAWSWLCGLDRLTVLGWGAGLVLVALLVFVGTHFSDFNPPIN